MNVPKRWTKHDVRAYLGKRKGEEVTAAATASFLRRHGEVVGHREETNSKGKVNVLNEYDPKQIREAVKNLAGQGGPGKPRPSRAKSA